MDPHNGHIALFIFCRHAAEEVLYKTFSHKAGRKVNQKISTELSEHAKRTAIRSGLPFFVISSERQKGETFGERLAKAFNEIFDAGYSSVISIGNDCPDLKESDLLKAAECLKEGKAVIGPDLRGGSYLIGLNRASFLTDEFAELPWNSKHLHKALNAWLEKQQTGIVHLREQADINKAEELHLLLQDEDFDALLKLSLCEILNEAHTIIFEESHDVYSSKSASSSLKRGPPLLGAC